MIEAKKMINIIKTLISSNNKNLHFNTKRKAVIQSLNIDGTVNITINNELFENVKIRAGLNPQVDEVVFVEVPNNILKDMYVDTASSVTGGGGSGEVAWGDIQGKPSSSVVNIDDAVTKRHTHSNQSILDGTQQSFTTTLKTKLDNIADNANNYTHPANHPPSIISQDSNNRFVTDTEKTTWNSKSDLALGETSITAYRGDRGKTAYDHSQTAHAPSNAEPNRPISDSISLDSSTTSASSRAVKIAYDLANHANSTYTHTQMVASDTWVIEHNLDRYPVVSVVDSAGSVVYGEITYDSSNLITVSFFGIFAGKAYLN